MIIAVEGHSYTGKTTIIDELSKDDGITGLAETDVYAGGIENYPPFPPTTMKMAQDNVEFFIELEQRRKKDCGLHDGTIVIDRSFLSVILFQKFVSQLPKDWESAVEYTKKRYVELIRQDKVILPDVMIIVSCATVRDYEERLAREVSVEELKSIDAYNFFTNEYLRIFEAYKKLGRLVEIVSSNDSDPRRLGGQILSQIPVMPLEVDEKKKLLQDIVGEI